MGYLIGILWVSILLTLLVGYIRLCLAMRAAAIRRPPYLHFLFVFGAIGGIVFFLPATGSPVGILALCLPTAPATLGIFISSFIIYHRHRDSRFHSAAFWSGMAYLGFVTLFMLVISIMAS